MGIILLIGLYLLNASGAISVPTPCFVLGWIFAVISILRLLDKL